MIYCRFRLYQEAKKLRPPLGLSRPKCGQKFGFRVIARHRLIQLVRCHTFWFQSMAFITIDVIWKWPQNWGLAGVKNLVQNMVFSLYGHKLKQHLSEFTLSPNLISVGPLQNVLVFQKNLKNKWKSKNPPPSRFSGNFSETMWVRGSVALY